MPYVRGNGVDIMSITVKTGKTNSDYFAVTKTVTDETSHTVSIVYPCDILNPTFSMKGGYINANYLTGAFNRKYWITNQTIDKGINYLHCTVDAWSSWSDNIYGSEQFVERSETDYNVFLPDGQFPLSNKNEIDMYKGNTIVTSTYKHVLGVI